jgi:hypothetical protein
MAEKMDELFLSKKYNIWKYLAAKVGGAATAAFVCSFFIPFFVPTGASMKLSVSLQFLNLGQSVGLLGRVISSSQDIYLHRTTQTLNKRTHTHKHPYLE